MQLQVTVQLSAQHLDFAFEFGRALSSVRRHLLDVDLKLIVRLLQLLDLTFEDVTLRQEVGPFLLRFQQGLALLDQVAFTFCETVEECERNKK